MRTRMLACLLTLTGIAAPAWADREVRTFAILVDGRKAGDERLTIETQSDGRTVVTSESEIKVRVLLYTFRYSFRGQETWQDGKLVSLESTCNDDGKRYALQAQANEGGLQVRVNGALRQVAAPVWPTTYWRLPNPGLRGSDLALLDPDNGQSRTGRLALVATESLTLAGRSVEVRHFRLTGKSPVDLWFDGSDRLVRQEWLEDGHRTVRQLAQIERAER